ncbi:hypothetical protein GCM10022419_009730 [Nonomuraea rosea]|uniref:CU044_5270 family protein n=1 Tax=Nonomuraea rosea TaxID=638574 RepID=A0ABP6VFE5_9ACTN
MNELDILRNHHDSLPGPSPEATARARALLTAEARTAAEQPPVVAAERSPVAVAVAERLPVAVDSTPAGTEQPMVDEEAGARRTFWPRPFRGRVILRGGIVLAVAAAMVVGVITMRGGLGGAAPAGAAELLQNAAAASAESAAPRPGQFTYVDRLDYTWAVAIKPGGVTYEYTQDVRREVWIPAGDPGKALARSTFAEPVRADGGSTVEGGMRPDGTVEYQRAGQCAMDVLRVPVAGIHGLEPGELLAKVRKDAETMVRSEEPGAVKQTEDQVARMIERTTVMELFRLAESPLVDARGRATVFEAVAGLPTATLVPDLTDPAGRHGLGVSVRYQGPDGWEREELIFEPETYAFLGWRSWTQIQQADGRMKETMRAGTAVFGTKVVDAMPEVPRDAGAPTLC